jgi:hypothetical protein
MDQHVPLPDGRQPLVYYGKHRTLLLIAASIMFAIFLVSLYLTIVPNAVPRTIRWPLFVFSPWLTLWTYYQAQHVCLVITHRGVSYYEIGYSIRSTWSNVQQIGMLPGHTSQKGIWLHQPAILISRRFRWMMASGEIDGRFIPLDRFSVPDDLFASQPIR